ncbi:DUF4167 domain-containing protein [Brevundimonas sp.]|uniref:DUF4167 domain-containing protein n=1 Tax=Brevundimonas sp. TaxID=1871086 RepID=UPI0011FE06CF|nr:DUF4167 domain-containing protein [Brevundimonas sp.]TAJ58608.1 MAG: DUF4167 domain-containing protein [Brevundimonas sp.]
MRDFKGMKRQRGRNRKPGGGGGNNNANATNPNRSWDSQGPENIKVRGNAQTVYERYMQLARDASAAGDRVLAENYTQHAEHYFRVLRALQPSRPVSEIAQRELAGQGFDIDFEDETGAQAAAIMAAEKVEADRVAQAEARQREADERQNDRSNDRPNDRQGEQPRREWRDRDDQPRADREPREPREPRAEGEGGFNADGSRRETRRERWERRQLERGARFEREGGEQRPEGEAPAAASDEVAEVRAENTERPERPERSERPERPARAERAERRPRRDAGVATDDGPSALPGFLTRSTAPAPAAAPETVEAASEVVAPKRRAPRRKAEAPAED